MNVLLLSPPFPEKVIKDQYCSSTSKTGYYWVPQELLVFSGILGTEHEVGVIDCIAENLDWDESLEKCKVFKPKFIVILSSGITKDSDFQFLRELKKLISFRSCFVGDVFYFHPEEMIKEDVVDSICYEYPTYEILKVIKDQRPRGNFVYLDGDTVVKTPKEKDYDVSYPVPLHEKFPLSCYSVPFMSQDRITSVHTNLGCVYSCSYCPVRTISPRSRSYDDIIDELNYLRSINIKNIWIRDATFGSDRKTTLKLLKTMAEDFDFEWFCLTRSEVLNEELVQLMKKAGCYLIMIGIDTVEYESQVRQNRRQNINLIKERISLVSSYGIQTLIHMIVGLPGEGVGGTLKTVHLAARSSANYLSVNYFSSRAGSIYDSFPQVVSLDSARISKRSTGLVLLKFYALFVFYLNPRRLLLNFKMCKNYRQLTGMFLTGIFMFAPWLKGAKERASKV